MVKDAEAHAEDDRKQRELVEARNNAENAAYQAEKQLGELGDAVDESSKESIQTAIKELRDSLESEDVDELRQKTEALQTAFHAVSEQMYAQAAQEAQADPAAAGNGASADGDAAAADDEEVVDAEVVDGEGRE
jgi:molecular chaperone DnaK